MSKRKFNREASLEAEEVILDLAVENGESSIDTATVAQPEQEPANVPMETAIPTATEIKFAQSFTGTPVAVDNTSLELAKSCAAKGLLADFGADHGYARGYKWHIHCK